MNRNLIQEIKKNFMGPRVTKEGSSVYWGTDELHERCLAELHKMSTEEKLQFLVDRGLIDVEPRDSWEQDPVNPYGEP